MSRMPSTVRHQPCRGKEMSARMGHSRGDESCTLGISSVISRYRRWRMSVEEEMRPAQLLLRAVDELPKADRERVLLWLLDPTPRNSGGLWALRSYTAGI